MTWINDFPNEWKLAVKAAGARSENPAMRSVFKRLQLVPGGYPDDEVIAESHLGAFRCEQNYTPRLPLTVINGDLVVDGTVSTAGIEGCDGNATLVVFGDLTCRSLVNDWASLIVVTGSCRVSDWVYAAREDLALIIGGDFTTDLFIGADLGVTVGGRVDVACGYGYFTPLANEADEIARPFYPRDDIGELAKRLGVAGDADTVAESLTEILDARLYKTGHIFP